MLSLNRPMIIGGGGGGGGESGGAHVSLNRPMTIKDENALGSTT